MSNEYCAWGEPGFGEDPYEEVARNIPADILDLYEVHSYRHAATILAGCAPDELAEIFLALRRFKLTTAMITESGGNESQIPKEFSRLLYPLGWHETRIQGDLLLTKYRHTPSGLEIQDIRRPDFLDGHKVDYVKNRVAFDLEWNSKDQTFDRDLYAARAFYDCGLISAGILVTRSARLNPVFERLGPNIKKKYGASTTWMGKLLYRLNAGRNGGCPMLVFGITERVLVDV